MSDQKSDGGVRIFGSSVVNATNIAGRDVFVSNHVSSEEISQVFAPLETLIAATEGSVRVDGLVSLSALKAETEKGTQADPKIVVRIVNGIIDTIPGAVKALVGAFTSPLLSAFSVPVTQAILKRLGQ